MNSACRLSIMFVYLLADLYITIHDELHNLMDRFIGRLNIGYIDYTWSRWWGLIPLIPICIDTIDRLLPCFTFYSDPIPYLIKWEFMLVSKKDTSGKPNLSFAVFAVWSILWATLFSLVTLYTKSHPFWRNIRKFPIDYIFSTHTYTRTRHFSIQFISIIFPLKKQHPQL